MALIDPCVAVPFDPKRGNDNRETNNEDQPLTPTDQSLTITAGNSSRDPNDPSTPSNNQSSTPAGPFPPPNLPHVLQSVFSYIFHSENNQSPNSQSNHASAVVDPSNNCANASSNPQSVRVGKPMSSQSTSRSYIPSTPPLTPLTNQELLDGVPVTPMSLNQTLNQSNEYSPSTSPTKMFHRFNQTVSQPVGQRPCAILDLDETLLHSFFPDKVTPYQYQFMVTSAKQQAAQYEQMLSSSSSDQPLPRRTLFEVDVGDGTIVVLHLRPYLQEFLEALFSEFEVGVWSAGGKLYVDAICRVLFPADGPFHPICQLCWDDVQLEMQGMTSYTKPLTTLTTRFPALQLNRIFLVDNRKENGFHFPHQLVQAPDYLPRPWEWQGGADRDSYLQHKAMEDIRACVRAMEARAKAYANEELTNELESDDEYQQYDEMQHHSVNENDMDNEYDLECDLDNGLEMQDEDEELNESEEDSTCRPQHLRSHQLPGGLFHHAGGH